MSAYRVEVYSADDKWVWGQWVDSANGSGTLVDRLERAAHDTLAAEPGGSKARVFRYTPRSTEPMQEVLTVSTPERARA